MAFFRGPWPLRDYVFLTEPFKTRFLKTNFLHMIFSLCYSLAARTACSLRNLLSRPLWKAHFDELLGPFVGPVRAFQWIGTVYRSLSFFGLHLGPLHAMHQNVAIFVTSFFRESGPLWNQFRGPFWFHLDTSVEICLRELALTFLLESLPIIEWFEIWYIFRLLFKYGCKCILNQTLCMNVWYFERHCSN